MHKKKNLFFGLYERMEIYGVTYSGIKVSSMVNAFMLVCYADLIICR
jgi:hypothetical protein